MSDVTGVEALWDALGLADRPDGTWHDGALCAAVDPDLFYPEKGGTVAEAKRVCAACPVREECLEEALAARERHGVWGGRSPKERRIQLARHDG